MGGSIFFFVESKTFEFSVEEGGTYFLLRIFERSWNSLRSVFMGRESAKCLLAIVEELMSTKTPSTFARTFRDNEKVFILQLGSNSHGSFLMISELIHGRRKGLLVVPEGKASSGWRGFGFHLRKAIAPGTLATKQPFISVLKPRVENHKTFLLAAAEGDRREGGGSRKGKQLMPEFQISTESMLSNKSHDIRDLNAGMKQAISKAELSVEITESNSCSSDSPLTLDVGLKLERGSDGEWKVLWSKVKEVGHIEKPKVKNLKPVSQFKPTAPFNAKPKLNPKPIKVWRPKPKQTLQNGETYPRNLTSASKSSGSDPSRGIVDSTSELPPADSQSLLRLAQSMKASDGAGIDFIGSDEPDNEILGADEPDNEILGSDESDTAFLSFDESDESANTSDGEEKLHQDIRLILKENSGNVSKKWGNS